MHCVISKLQDIPFKYFAVSLTELNNYLPILPSSRATKKIPPEELNDILLYAVLNGWEKKAYIQGWDFETKN